MLKWPDKTLKDCTRHTLQSFECMIVLLPMPATYDDLITSGELACLQASLSKQANRPFLNAADCERSESDVNLFSSKEVRRPFSWHTVSTASPQSPPPSPSQFTTLSLYKK